VSAPGTAALELQAPAKVNLYLAVPGRRPDGYHEVLTVLQTVDLCDTLRLQFRERRPGVPAGAPDVRLALTAEELPPPADAAPPTGARDDAPRSGDTRAADARAVPDGADNLAVAAALALLRATGAAGEVGLDLALHKRIPAGGGLGGGSSDAAAALAGLHALLGRPLEAGALARLAATLGSDVPFFLHGGTALCSGRGESVEPIAPPSSFVLRLFVPPFGTSTPAVYAALGAGPLRAPPTEAERRRLRDAVAGADESALRALYRNDLQAAAARAVPALGALLADPALHLSGSGSTCFTFGADSAARASGCRTALICSRAT
jgi:4-diphosphocytidyl-2-C-methyl-D-erythritol kinase